MADTQLPLLGVILCCTSIPPEQRSEVAAIASQMGAVHKLDLTSDVTHLVVGETDTPKYKFVAKERMDVKCVSPSWIEAVRASWLEGGETNVEHLEREHKLPTFTGLRLCVTGFDDLIYRKQLEDLIGENGGEYRGNLTKDVSHLVAKEPSGAKYNFAGQWGIQVVSVEWLEHSLQRGMILDEALYHLSIPPEERGRNAWIRRSTSTTSIGKRSRGDELAPQNARKLRRTASARLSSQNVGLWSELVGAPVKLENDKPREWEDQSTTTVIRGGEPATTKPEDVKIATGADDTLQTLKRTPSEVDLGSLPGQIPQKKVIFHGTTVLLQGFDKKKTTVLQKHLESHGAGIIEDASQLPPASNPGEPGKSFLVIPHTTSARDAPLDYPPLNQPTVVTDLWVERCLHQKKLVDAQAHVTNVPFFKLPIRGFEGLVICSTGFQGIDLLHVSKAVNLMGATYSEYFTPNTSIIVCNTFIPGHEKLRHAQLWSVPAVKAAWLWDSIREGELKPFRSYLTQPLIDQNQLLGVNGALDDKDATLKKTNITDKQESTDTTRRPAKRKTFTEDRFKPVHRKASHSENQEESSDDLNFQPPPKPRDKLLPNGKIQTPAIYQDGDTPNPTKSNVDDIPTDILASATTPTPLQEITPNSSPPKRSVTPKVPSPSKSKEPPSPLPPPPPSASEDSSLGPTISSLLAHHQRSNSNPPPTTSSDQPRMYRRRRQLFGRAPSNLSSHSHSGLNLSRASSVDTMNTDGLGTPLEASKNTTTKAEQTIHDAIPNKDLINIYTASMTEDPDRIEEPLQMTQLGYEDPDVAAWRERVAVKMSGGKVKGTTPARKSANAVDSGNGSLGIAKRTRLATGR